MQLQELLTIYYAVQWRESKVIDGKAAFFDRDSVYYPVPVMSERTVHMEQAALAYYLMETGYKQIAIPLQNVHGDWITNYLGKEYQVLKVNVLKMNSSMSHGNELALFHQRNMAYKYEPKYISSYGKWKRLWIDKLTYLESKIKEEAVQQTNNYYQLLLDVLPYLIGISENAIQLIQESEQDQRFNESDQGTICLHRYDNHLLNHTIWTSDLVYDHPIRDVSEQIRFQLLKEENSGLVEVQKFLNEYENIQPLSMLSYRMLYARLVYPIHLFDKIEQGFRQENKEECYQEMIDLLARQDNYEKSLRELHEEMIKRNSKIKLPVLHWL